MPPPAKKKRRKKRKKVLSYVVQKRVDIVGLRLLSLERPAC